MNIKQQYELLKQVFEHGKTLQILTVTQGWQNVNANDDIRLLFGKDPYRIKPEPREWMVRPPNDFDMRGCCQNIPVGYQPTEPWVRVREVLD